MNNNRQLQWSTILQILSLPSCHFTYLFQAERGRTFFTRYLLALNFQQKECFPNNKQFIEIKLPVISLSTIGTSKRMTFIIKYVCRTKRYWQLPKTSLSTWLFFSKYPVYNKLGKLLIVDVESFVHFRLGDGRWLALLT